MTSFLKKILPIFFFSTIIVVGLSISSPARAATLQNGSFVNFKPTGASVLSAARSACGSLLATNGIDQGNPNYSSISQGCQKAYSAAGLFNQTQAAAALADPNYTPIAPVQYDTNMTKLLNDMITNQDDSNAIANDLSQITTASDKVLQGTTGTVNNNQKIIEQGLQNQATQCFQYGGITSGFPTVNVGACFNQVIAYFSYFALWFSAWVLTMSGSFLDFVMGYTVVGLKGNLDKLDVLHQAWADIRSIGNIVFVFVAIFIALQTIVGLNYGNTKRLIRNLIIAALLVNFSLFFTQILIDASNILTIAFYNLTVGGQHALGSFSQVFAQPLGIQTVFTFPNPSSDTTQATITSLAQLGFFSIIIVGLGGSIFLLATAVSFLVVGVLFAIRFVVLIFLMILSPLAFLFFGFPGSLQTKAKEWLQTLVGQLAFGVIYMMLIFVVALLVRSATSNYSISSLSQGLLQPILSQSGGQNLATQTANVGATIGSCNTVTGVGCSTVGQIFFFILIILLMNAALYFAIQWAKYGNSLVATAVTKASGTITGGAKYIAGRTVGTTAAIAGKTGRSTLGRAATSLTNEETRAGAWLARQTSRGLGVGALARGTQKALGGVATASFDARATGLAKSFTQKTGLALGKAQGEGGYKKKVDDDATKLAEKAQKLGGPSAETVKELARASAARSNAAKELVRATALADSKPEDEKWIADKVKEAEQQLKDAKNQTATTPDQERIKQGRIAYAQKNLEDLKNTNDPKYKQFIIKRINANLKKANEDWTLANLKRKAEKAAQQAAWMTRTEKWYGQGTAGSFRFKNAGVGLGALSPKHAASYDKAMEELAKNLKKKPATDEEKKAMAAENLATFKDLINPEKPKKDGWENEIKKLRSKVDLNDLAEEIANNPEVMKIIGDRKLKDMVKSQKVESDDAKDKISKYLDEKAEAEKAAKEAKKSAKSSTP